MKKKQRCFVKRFAALVAALMLCASLCFPAFASNNASTKKWVVVAEEQMRGENGALTKYFKLSPYQNGALYQTIFTTQYGFADKVISGNSVADVWACPLNYPDWWRADIPLGATSYIEFSNIALPSGSYNGKAVTDWQFIPIYRPYIMDYSFSAYSSATSFSGKLSVVPVLFVRSTGTGLANTISLCSSGFRFSSSEISPDLVVRGPLQSCMNLTYTPVLSMGGSANDFEISNTYPFFNCSSNDLAWIIAPDSLVVSPSWWDTYAQLSIRATMSYWVDALKLPPGLKIGDEFPADTDAFDNLRDDLIDQFPEASDNIQNGKDTIQGWNDTETVDTDVASTSISALNAMFQNLGGFLFIVSLMVFGAVVLRMLIRKAVDG